MDLVNEKNGTIGLFQLAKHALESFLEITAILRTRNQGTQVQRIDRTVLEHIRYFTVNDFLRQPFRQRGFADACFTDQQRIVFSTPA